MDLKAIFSPLIKFWWLLAAAAFVSAVSSFLITSQQPPIYQSHTTLVVGRAVYEANPTSNDLWLSQQLAGFYAEIANRSEVRNATMETLGITWLPEYVVSPLPNTQLLEIVVTDTSAIRAQAVAGELARQLIQISPTSSTSQGSDRQAFIDEQVVYLEGQIKVTLDEISTAEKQLSELKSARQISEKQDEIRVLQEKLTQQQDNYTQLVANSREGAVNTLSIIENASLPQYPVGPNKKLMILLSVVVAIAIAAAAAYLLDYLDDTLKSSDDTSLALNMPVFGQISETLKGSNTSGVYVANNPRQLIAEEFRSLRVNLDFADVDQPIKTLLITSTNPSEGKTFVASNLAVVMAQGGRKVILIDADLRKPNVHNSFQIPNKMGLVDLLGGFRNLNDVLQFWKDENLAIITTGNLPPNPTDVISSKKMNALVEHLKTRADIVIIDGPPLILPDSVVLSTKVDGVLMIVKHASTRRNPAKASLEKLTRVGARVVGVVVNILPRTRVSYYSRYSHYTYYGEIESRGPIEAFWHKLKQRFGRNKEQPPSPKPMPTTPTQPPPHEVGD